MHSQVYKVLLYYVLPALVLGLIVLLLYHLLLVPIGMYLLLAIAGVTIWTRFKQKTDNTIQNAERLDTFIVWQ